MFTRIKRKLEVNHKANRYFLIVFFLLITCTSIGYSALSQSLMISGEVDYEQLPCSSFASDSWETIVSCAQNRNTSSYHVGDTKTVDLGTLGTHTLRVANNTTPSECSQSGFSQTACGFVLEFADIIIMRNINSTSTNAGGWPASEMRTYVNSTVYSALPAVLRDAIIDTTVVSGHGRTGGETNFTSTDKLYLLSSHEVWEGDSLDTAYSNSRQLDYYARLNVTSSNYSGAIKRMNGSTQYWWLRTPYYNDWSNFINVFRDGESHNNVASESRGVSPAFRLGPSFATDSWETIVTNVQTGNTDYYHVGDEKEVDMGSLGTHTLRIANMSNPSACNAIDYSQTGCGFVLEFVDIITTHNMNNTVTNVGSWPASSMRSYVNSDIYNALPVALKNGIINTSVISGHGSTTGESNFISTDKLYLLNTKEVSGGNSDTDYNTTRQLDYYEGIPITSSSYGGAIKKLNGTNATWWLRNPNSARNDYFKHVDATGNSSTSTTAENNGGVSPAFRLTGPAAHELVELTYDSQNGSAAETMSIVKGSAVTLPSAEKIGYTFTGWYDAASGGNRVGGTGDNYTVSATTILYAQYVITNPETPSVSGGGTKVYGSSAATITCSTETTYGTGMDIYYSFGYADSDGGTPSNWTTATTSATHTVATDYIGQRWYSCKVYATDGSTTSSTITSATTADTELTINNATLTFDATTNGGVGGGIVYTKNGVSVVYSGIRNTTTISIPSASKTGWTFTGWYTESSGGSKVLNADGTLTGTVISGYTSTTTWTVTEDKTLYAQFSANTYTIGYIMNGTGAQSITNGTYDETVAVTKPTKTFTVNIDANSQGASITSGGNAVTNTSSQQTFAGWTASNLNNATALYGSSSNDVTNSWNGNTKVGGSYETTYFKNLRSETGTVTLVANWTAVAVTLPKIEKAGYTCGYATSASGTMVYQSEGSYTPSTTTGSTTLYAKCTAAAPDVPTISGGVTKIYGASTTTLTCITTTTYDAGTNIYYSFGYAAADGETPDNWTTATTTQTLTISATEYVGDRYYSCRVYASDGTNTTTTVTSLPASNTLVRINNASIIFDATTNGGTGGGTSYTRTGSTGLYAGIQSSTVTTLPATTAPTYHIVEGWYTLASGGDKVLNGDGTFTGTAVPGYTTTTAWAITTSKTLYARYLEVRAENLSFDDTHSGNGCNDTQCMIDYLANRLS